MPLREEFRSTGEWLFRWRSYLALFPLALVLLVTLTSYTYPSGSHTLHLAWGLFCFSIALAGLAVRVLTVGFVPGGTSGRNTGGQRADALNTTGIYATVRHPLYVGNFLMWLGIALYPREWWLAVIVVLTFWLYYERIMLAEEEFLRDRYGDDYLGWAERTPAFLPRASAWTPPALPFSLRTVLRREFSGLFGIISSFGALELAAFYTVHGYFGADPLWLAVFIGGLVIYAVLRLIKKRGVLDVAGR